MWKIAVAFVVFAALALFMLSKGDIDMSGEKHGADATHPAPAAVAASTPAAPASEAASAAAAPASAASK